jgi:hypothetical protein
MLSDLATCCSPASSHFLVRPRRAILPFFNRGSFGKPFSPSAHCSTTSRAKLNTSPTKRSSDCVAHLEQLDGLYGPGPGQTGSPSRARPSIRRNSTTAPGRVSRSRSVLRRRRPQSRSARGEPYHRAHQMPQRSEDWSIQTASAARHAPCPPHRDRASRPVPPAQRVVHRSP